jgi:NADPH2:quinone reductase
MRAVVCTEYGDVDALQVRDVARPEPGPGEILVRVAAAGVNFPDGLMVRGEYQTTMVPPFVPGSEVAGVVEAVGEGGSALAPGTRVVAFCGTGGYAEYAVARTANAVELPVSVAAGDAAGLIVAHGTALHALVDRARLAAGETVLVLGAAGGVGLATVQLAHLLGATVIAVASTPAKRELATAEGADHAIDYGDDLRERCRELTGGRGVNVVVDMVGGSIASQALRSLAWDGRYLVVGFAAGEIPSVAFNRLLLNSTGVLGVLWGQWARRNPEANRDHLRRLVEWVAQDRLRPRVDRTFALDDAPAALAHVMQRRVAGKVVLTVDAESLK